VTTQTNQIQTGWDVYGSDGEKIGTIDEVGANYVVVQKGFFFPTDIYIPTSAVTSVGEDRVEISATKDSVEGQGWDQPPVADAGAETYAGDTSYETTDVRTTDDAYVGAAPTDTTDTYADTSDSGTIERREEQLQARTREEQAGEVRISKDVVHEEQSIDVPVTREEVQVSSRQVDRPASGDAFSDQDIAVPVMEEDVEVTKEARVVEEFDVDKQTYQDTERVTDTVRKERVDIDETGNVRRDDDRSNR
jgi:uncharacterized protein (TIGR02271 family)